MRFDVFTLFPEVFDPYLETSILKRAIDNELLEVHLHNIRNWAADKHHTTDDTPYGGGGGMIMKPEPVFAAVEAELGYPPDCPLILLTPQGKPFNQNMAMKLSEQPRLGLLCGRYEGIDERIRQHLVSKEISIGDYVLSGGELPALVLIETIARLIPGMLGDPKGAADDSFASSLLEYPHYTRPPTFRGWEVPDILLSGNHASINQWHRKQALQRTLKRRPDLLTKADLSQSDIEQLYEIIRNTKLEIPNEIKEIIKK
ncbi:MAG TPA: tRNA (guanosine(37)-N1)-methyltransferase TrmD [Anaerolineae bacterium]|nr:tRNA (guanosine(37)-N1)-methyltransferase TrmD [Anaerolineae bacterium]